MLEQPERARTRKDTVLFVICVLLSAAALFAPRSFTDPVAGALRGTVLYPFIELQRLAEEQRASRARLEAIQAERDSVSLAFQRLLPLQDENDRLRTLLGLTRSLAGSYVAAEVLHQPQPTDGRTLLLSAGSTDGVRPFLPVVGPLGLLGMVSEVDVNSSVALTWTHPEFRASAFTAGGGVFGIVVPATPAGASEPLLELRGVPYRDTVPPGTTVFTSGLGGIYPRGIPVGQVMGVSRELTGWERTYLVRPAANPKGAAHALIIDPATVGSLEGVFAPEDDSGQP